MSLSSLTQEWDDDKRMNFMFSAFKDNRDVNTTDWDSKMNFWTSLVVKSVKQRGSVCFRLQELDQTFRRGGKSPLGLATVIQTMASSGEIQREAEFAANVDCGWMSWGVGLLLVKPLLWTFSTLLGSSLVPPGESFVVIELVEEKAAELLQKYRSSEFASRCILSYQELLSLSSGVCADESTLCLVLLQLQREKRVTVSIQEGEKIVKFCQPGQDRVSPLSDVDIGIYQLQCSEKLLGERGKKLGLEADQCKEEARMMVRDGQKPQALKCLRGRKRAAKRADSLFCQLESIRGILDRIDQSQTDKMVIQAYQAGVTALRLSLKNVTVERAESLVDQIQELCDTQDEVNQTLSSGVTSGDEDMDDLEEELKLLLDETKPERSLGLPDVPTSILPGRNLPDVPRGGLGVSSRQLEEELSQEILTHSGSNQRTTTSPAKRLEPAQ